MPDLPNMHAGFVLALSGLALILFATDRVRLETAAFLILLALLLLFTIVPYSDPGSQFQATQLFSAFGSEALIAVCALMILGQGVETTKALQPMVGYITRYWSVSPQLTLLAVLAGGAAFSAFLNNTPIVVLLIPVLISIAKKNNVAPAQVLMPIGLATIIGGMATTIGTSTNLLVVSLADEVANVKFGMFEFTEFVAIAGGVGLLYLWQIAPRIMPIRESQAVPDSQREYIATLHIDEESPVVNKTLADLLERCHRNIKVDRIQHAQDTFRNPLPTVQLYRGDQVFVRGTATALKEAEHALRAPLRTLDNEALREPDADPTLMEILVTERSELHGNRLATSGIAETYGIVAVAIHRPEPRGRRKKRALERIRLEAGDILLCEGTRDQFDRLLAGTRLLALGDPTELLLTGRAQTALIIMAAVVAAAALGWAPISISALAGVAAMLLTRCMGWRHVRQALSTQVILIIVVSLALGQALMATQGDVYLASLFVAIFQDSGPVTVVAALMLFMALLTNVVSNNAAAVIGTPVGIEIAGQMAISPEPLILAVLFGANLSFATPIGYQTNLLLMTAGGYRFMDFVKVGTPLTLIMWAILSWLLCRAYGLL